MEGAARASGQQARDDPLVLDDCRGALRLLAVGFVVSLLGEAAFYLIGRELLRTLLLVSILGVVGGAALTAIGSLLWAARAGGVWGWLVAGGFLARLVVGAMVRAGLVAAAYGFRGGPGRYGWLLELEPWVTFLGPLSVAGLVVSLNVAVGRAGLPPPCGVPGLALLLCLASVASSGVFGLVGLERLFAETSPLRVASAIAAFAPGIAGFASVLHTSHLLAQAHPHAAASA